MAKLSAGVLLYRKKDKDYEVLLGHPGGPFYWKKDNGVWSIPKGEFDEGEDPLAAAKREFEEEIGSPPPSGDMKEVGSIRLSNGKIIYAWALEGDMDVSNVASNNFELEWPPKSGNMQKFPEIDRAGWFSLPEAAAKITKSQIPLLNRLVELLKLDPFILDDNLPPSLTQSSLF